MRALLKDTFRFKGNTEFAGKWVDIDTSYVFNDQYNTTEEFGNMRIFDGDIVRVEDDVRPGLGRCKYCGKLIKVGEEEQHFAERESNSCDGCWWYKRKYDWDSKEKSVETKVENGIEITKSVEKIPFTMECDYGERGKCGCANKECRAYGIEWFTPKNTFFLKYPLGFKARHFEIKENCRDDWDMNHNWREATYKKKLGSYKLYFSFYNSPGWKGSIDYIVLRNSRNTIKFNVNEDGTYTIYSGINGSPRIRKHLLDTDIKSNEKVLKDLLRILDEIKED